MIVIMSKDDPGADEDLKIPKPHKEQFKVPFVSTVTALNLVLLNFTREMDVI